MKNTARQTLSPIVRAIGNLHRSGDIIPYGWWKQPKLCFETGRPNLVAIHVLANILYWYTPTRSSNCAPASTKSPTCRWPAACKRPVRW